MRASDIFSFGCVLYEMLTGNRTFSRNNSAETIAAILKEEPPTIARSGKQVPPELEGVISHCLEKNPEKRFQSAQDLAFHLRQIISSSEISKPTIEGSRKIMRRPHPAVWISIMLLFLAAGISLYFLKRSGETINSVAVLPFTNVSGDTNTEYLTDGITENIISRLSQLPSLKVTSRNSAFHYKGREIDPEKIGNDLNVGAIVMGRVLHQRRKNLSISVELINTNDNTQLWGDQYNRKMADVFTVEQGISKEICTESAIKANGSTRKEARKERYGKHQKLISFISRVVIFGIVVRPMGSRKALSNSNKRSRRIRVTRRPTLVWRTAIIDLGTLSYVSPQETMPQGKAAALKALELDDSLADAHAALGFVKWIWEWDRKRR